MTELSDNVQRAISSAVQSASIHMDYVGDLQHGYHRDANAVGPETTDIQATSTTSLDNAKQQEDKNATGTASTAIGLPDPSAVATAIDQEDKKVQDADDEPGVASTATGLPASEPIINAMKEGDDDNTTIQSAATKENTPLSKTTTLEKAGNAALEEIDNLTSDSQNGPGPNPSKMKHQQQQPEKSCPSRTIAESDQTGNDGDANPPPAASATNVMKESTHTLIDDHITPPIQPTPVEPVVENIVANIESVEEPVVEEEIIRDPPPATVDVAQALDSTRPTPADVKTEDLPNLEVRTQVVGDPVAEHSAPAEQMVVTEDPDADEIKVEQVSPAAVTTPMTTAASDTMPVMNMEVADIKTENMPVAEEPATIDDVKMKRVDVEQTKNDDDGNGVLPKDEPIKKDGTVHKNDVNVEQQQPAVDELAAKKDEGGCTAAKEKNASPTSDNTATESDNTPAPVDGQSRSLESKSLHAQTLPEQQKQASAATSEEQSNASKSSKCAIM